MKALLISDGAPQIISTDASISCKQAHVFAIGQYCSNYIIACSPTGYVSQTAFLRKSTWVGGDLFCSLTHTHAHYDISFQYLLFVNCSFVSFFTILLSKCFLQSGREEQEGHSYLALEWVRGGGLGIFLLFIIFLKSTSLLRGGYRAYYVMQRFLSLSLISWDSYDRDGSTVCYN